MRIGTIFTGGTIGSQVDQNGYIATRQTAPFVLLELYRSQFGDTVEFVTREPYRILSENLQASNILALIQCVEECLQTEDLNGLIVTHGTDTLQYTSAILGYMFGNVKIPIVLVSSNYVLEDSRANGLTNFRYAVEFIKYCSGKTDSEKLLRKESYQQMDNQRKYGTGVFVSYCNIGDVPTIHRATRLQPPVPFSDYVSSVGDSWYGRFEKGSYVANSDYKTREGWSSFPEMLIENRESGQTIGNVDVLHQSSMQVNDSKRIRLSEQAVGILRIIPCVGMVYPELSSDIKAVLHESFHSGTICISEELKFFAERAREQGIPIYLTGLSEHEKSYETVKSYESLGIQPLPGSAVIAQYCKLWLAVSNQIELTAVMNTAIAEDFLA